MKRALVLSLVLLAGCGGSGSGGDGGNGGDASGGDRPRLVDAPTADVFAKAFDEDRGSPRLVVLLAPT